MRRLPSLLSLVALSPCLCALVAGCGGHAEATSTCADVLPASCPAPMPSYARDVAPIVTERCVSCHGPGGQSAYMPLGDYNALYREREEVLQVLEQCVMPPGGATQPTDVERATVLGWLVCGSPNN